MGYWKATTIAGEMKMFFLIHTLGGVRFASGQSTMPW